MKARVRGTMLSMQIVKVRYLRILNYEHKMLRSDAVFH